VKWRIILAVVLLVLLAHSVLAEEAVRGQVVARDRAVLSSQLDAIVSILRVREGDTFKAGATLIDLDCRGYKAQLAQAGAAERLAKAVLHNTQSLARMESASVQEVEKARAELDICAQAKVLAQLDVERCGVLAPFAGAVVSLPVGKGEFVSAGKPLLEIVGTDNLEVHFLLPSTAAQDVQPDQPFVMDVYEINATVNGTVRQVAPVADPLNRTIKVFGQLRGDSNAVRPGMSGTVVLVR
jgi:RND family efflux transporter MFP subunit